MFSFFGNMLDLYLSILHLLLFKSNMVWLVMKHEVTNELAQQKFLSLYLINSNNVNSYRIVIDIIF